MCVCVTIMGISPSFILVNLLPMFRLNFDHVVQGVFFCQVIHSEWPNLILYFTNVCFLKDHSTIAAIAKKNGY